jgi:Ethanolamine utilization protein EutJ (predicted chaperonin)
MMANCWRKEPNDRPTFSQMADVIAKEIESVVGIDYLNLNGGESENDSIKEIVDPTETDRLEIVKLFNETRKSPSPTDGMEI